ncbi:amidase [Methylovirgula sp. 4M-Z18]|uniref:amidase n=1 Tax=Methylovirgula sp. 4M-Z18 TaxID=2293567 RepID=UPI000E2FC8BA|nr:amidase [Methylovirgula sp. 4M-Z18]RFB78156.1 amidase [Methylovirgula sp. 4M-Z18]
MTDLLTLPASVLRQKLLARDIGARELLDLTLARMATINPQLNAIVQTDLTGAKAAADESDARLARGEARALEGLPMTIKDAYDVAGMIATAGAPALQHRVPEHDASAVARLRQAGAVIFGKTNVPLYSGDFQAYNAIYGTTNNPWDLARSPGGSSGGAVAAVATGMSALELGSDLGGSIRWPAHACGLFGLKTTWDLVSTFGHVPPPPGYRSPRNPELTVAGPIARSAADLGLMLDVIAGPRDPHVPAEPFAPARTSSAKGLRVALWLDEPLAPVDRLVAEAVRDAAGLLEGAGAIVDPAARPAFSFAEAYEVYAVLNHALVAFGLPDKVRDKLAEKAKSFAKGDLSHPALQSRGARLAAEDYADLVTRRATIRRGWADFFKHYDAVLCPPAPVGAIPHDQSDYRTRRLNIDGEPAPYLDFLKWSSLATGGDLPAAVAPVMLGPDGLPRGVQIIAGAFEDRTAISVVGLLEELTGGYRRPPILGM